MKHQILSILLLCGTMSFAATPQHIYAPERSSDGTGEAASAEKGIH